MSALAISLVLLSALFHALRSLFTKESGDKQVFLWLYSIFALIFFSPLFIYFLFQVGITNSAAYAWCAGSGFIHFLYWIFLTQSYKEGDLSHVYPIMRSSPALVLVFAVLFLGEQVSVQGVTGILMVAVGVYIINMKHISGEELFAPLISIVNDRSTRFAFLTLFSVAMYSIVDKMAVDRLHPVLFAFLHLFCGMCYYTPYIVLTKKAAAIKKRVEHRIGADYPVGGDRYIRILTDFDCVYDRAGQLYCRPATTKRGVCGSDGKLLAQRKAYWNSVVRGSDNICRLFFNITGQVRLGSDKVRMLKGYKAWMPGGLKTKPLSCLNDLLKIKYWFTISANILAI